MDGIRARTVVDTLATLHAAKPGNKGTVADRISAAYGVDDFAAQMGVLTDLAVGLRDLADAAALDPMTRINADHLKELAQAAMSVALNVGWGAIGQRLTDSANLALQNTANYFLTKSGLDLSAASDLRDFLDDVAARARTLQDDIADAEIDPDLKAVLLDALGDITVAVAAARAGRTVYLRERARQAVGSVVVNPKVASEARHRPIVASAVHFLTALSLMWTPVGIAADTVSLAQALDRGSEATVCVIAVPPAEMAELMPGPAALPTPARRQEAEQPAAEDPSGATSIPPADAGTAGA